MRCFICDRVIDEVQYNSDHKDYDPCETCLAVITDLVQGYDEESYTVLDEYDDPDDAIDYYRHVAPDEYEY